MLLSASEVKRQLMENATPADVPFDWADKRNEYIEVGQHIKRMTGTNGWKLLEVWLTRQLDLNVILNGTDADRLRAKAFGDVLKQVNYWISMGEKASEDDTKKE